MKIIKKQIKKSALFTLLGLMTVLFSVEVGAMRLSPEAVKRAAVRVQNKPVVIKLPITEAEQHSELEFAFVSDEELAETQKIKLINNLILILDSQLEETDNGKSISMNVMFVAALQEKVSPIIISSNIVKNFCSWKINHRQILEVIKQEALNTKSIDLAIKKAQESLKLGLDPRFLFMLSITDLSDNDWNCYTHKEADLVLLIPKKYSARCVVRSQFEVGQVESCGFNSANLSIVNDVSPESVLKQIEAKKSAIPINIVNAVKSVFVLDKPSDFTWDIFWTGHGNSAERKKDLKIALKRDQEDLDNYRNWAKDAKSKGDLLSEEFNLKKAGVVEERVKSQLLLLQSAENLSDEEVVPQSARIAGTKFDDCMQLMTFFDRDIETNLLYYGTCAGGGYNQTFVNDVLQKVEVNFIVITEGVSEERTCGFIPTFEFNENSTEIVLSRMRFTNFFGLLEIFFGESTNIVGVKVPQNWQKDPIASIAATIAELSVFDNQPFVRIPAVGVFTALNVDKKVKILTNSVVKAYELEGRTIDLTSSAIETIIVYPVYVGVPIKKTKQNILSPTPQKVEQLYKSTHVFEEIITDNPLFTEVLNFKRLNESYSTITFVIKKLMCLNYDTSDLTSNKRLLSDTGKEMLPIENLIIQVGGMSGLAEATFFRVLFMLDGKTYLFSPSNLKRFFAKNGDYFSNNLINQTDIKLLAQKMVDKRDIHRLEGQFIDAALIAKLFEERVDKSLRVQQVGAFKKVMEKREEVGTKKRLFEENKEFVKQLMNKNLESQKKELEALK